MHRIRFAVQIAQMINPFAAISTAKLIGTGIALSVAASAVSYVWGRVDGARICTANAAWLAEDLRGKDDANADEADAADTAATNQNEAIEAKNDEIEARLGAGSGGGPVVLTRGWLRDLQRLK